MRYLRTVGMVFAADILALFISLTLAGSSLWLIKAVSAVCGAGILIIIMSSFCVKTAAEDCRLERTGEGGGGTLTGILMGLSASAPGLLSWGALALSVKNGFEFYRWHKLLNGFFCRYSILSSRMQAPLHLKWERSWSWDLLRSSQDL